MTKDLLFSLLGYAGVICAALTQIFFVGKLMAGRGRIVILAIATLAAGLVLQAMLQRNVQICVGDICLRTLTRWLDDVLSNSLWSPDWIASHIGATLINSTLLLAGPGIILACSAAARLFSDAPLDVVEDRKDALRRLLIGKGSKSLYRVLLWAAILTGGAIIALAAYNPRGAAWRDLVEYLGSTVWSAPILCFGLLWATCRTIKPESNPDPLEDSSESDQPPRIAELYQSYLADYKDQLLFAAELKASGQTDADVEADRGTIVGRVVSAAKSLGYSKLGQMQQSLDAALNRFWAEPEPGTHKSCPIFEESPTFLHFIMFAELVLSCQDRGGSTLIIAPQTSLRRIRYQLQKALSVHFAGYTQRIWIAEGQPPQGIYDVVLVSPELMETHLLSRDDGSIVDLLNRLDLVIVLDYQNIDAALLRIRLARLRRLIRRRSVSVICQSEPRAGLQQKLANTISAFVPVTPVRIDIGRRGSAERFWLLWRNDEKTLEKILDVERGDGDASVKPVEVVPLTLLRAINQSYRSIFFDPYGRAHRSAWSDFLKASLMPKELSDLNDADWALFPEQGDRVVAIEDLANLVSAVRKNMNFMHHADCLTHVVSHNYPMREYLREIVQQQATGSGYRSDGWSRIGETYLPIAPHPTGGPIELAIDLATEFLRNRTVTQHEIEARFREVLPGGVSEDLGISPTKQGLESLFSLQRDFGTEVNIVDTGSHEYAFEINIQGRANLEPNFLLPVRMSAGQAPVISYVDQQDEGLTYCRGSLLQIGGHFYQIQYIFSTHITVDLAQLPGAYRPTYLFAKQYNVHFMSRQMSVEDKNVPAAAMRNVYMLRLLLRGSYDRTTVAMATADELTFDLAGGDGAWKTVHVEKSSPNASMMLVRFALPSRQSNVAPDEIAFSQLAFTLAATLQDTLRSFFPALAPSLAVMSPQAEPSIKYFLQELESKYVDPLEQLPFNLYPRLVTGHFEPAEPQDQSHSGVERRRFDDLARPAAPEPLVRRVINEYIRKALVDSDQTIRIAGTIQNQLFTEDANRIIDLIVVEDASHDRGAVRALFEDHNWSNVTTAWAGFVQWAARQKPSDENFFYAFGRGGVPSVLAFKAAAEFLQTATQSRDSPRPPTDQDR